MTYLLDVNALIALGYKQHVFHKRVSAWAARKSIATCSIAELGFVRILAQIPEVDIPLATSQELLATMKRERRLTQISDSQSAIHLPKWVQTPRQITDGHLLVLAQSNGLTLATCDEGIPGAFLIP